MSIRVVARDFVGFEKAAFWLHVGVAFVLLRYFIGDKVLTINEWFRLR